jgi:hypothetical protein
MGQIGQRYPHKLKLRLGDVPSSAPQSEPVPPAGSLLNYNSEAACQYANLINEKTS